MFRHFISLLLSSAFDERKIIWKLLLQLQYFITSAVGAGSTSGISLIENLIHVSINISKRKKQKAYILLKFNV